MRLAHTAAAFVAVLVLAQPAIALPPGVFIAPGSPAGKEYSFPLSVLRGDAGGHTGSAGTAEPPLFGVGVKPVVRRGAGSAKAHRASNSAAGRRHRRARGPAASINQGGRHREAVLASLVRPSSDVPQIALIAVVLLVVAVASGAGIAASRRRN
jgi:hypothetical protein